VIKLRRIRWAGHVGLVRERRGEARRGEVSTGVWWRNLRERDHLDNIKIDLQEVGLGGGGEHGLDSSGLGQGEVTCTCKCSNKLLASIKYGEFLD
jgi:hypothetical protein